MAKDINPPSIKKAAFDCPHCGAYTTQYWFILYAKQLEDEKPLPFIIDKQTLEEVENDKEISSEKKAFMNIYKRLSNGLVSFETLEYSHYCTKLAQNLHVSLCYHCKKVAVWVHDNLVFPHVKQGVLPNQDLPANIINDFEEARSIVGLSPRGAAALLRLCIQKLCAFLGEKGKNIDEDIASLVKKGLNPLVQKSLDIVRVIGNEAVHPGVIDLNDDRDTANKLFDLVNSITDQMVSHPKSVQELYGKLPELKRKAIEERNGEVQK